jgi:predicted amidophosphoribosyltransferase
MMELLLFVIAQLKQNQNNYYCSNCRMIVYYLTNPYCSYCGAMFSNWEDVIIKREMERMKDDSIEAGHAVTLPELS